MFGYYIEEVGIPMNLQKERNNLTSIRVGKVSSIFTEREPSILPFKGGFPLISENSIDNYIDAYSECVYFEDVPRFLKNIVYQAEQIVYYTRKFLEYLEGEKINEDEFSKLDAKTKLKHLEGFLDEEQIDIGFLQIKNYE